MNPLEDDRTVATTPDGPPIQRDARRADEVLADWANTGVEHGRAGPFVVARSNGRRVIRRKARY